MKMFLAYGTDVLKDEKKLKSNNKLLKLKISFIHRT